MSESTHDLLASLYQTKIDLEESIRENRRILFDYRRDIESLPPGDHRRAQLEAHGLELLESQRDLEENRDRIVESIADLKQSAHTELNADGFMTVVWLLLLIMVVVIFAR